MHERELPRTDLCGKFVLQARDQIVIKFHSHDVGTTRQKSLGQESKPWTNLQDQPTWFWSTCLHDPVANVEIMQKVLAQALLRRMAVNTTAARRLTVLWTHAGTAVPMRHCACTSRPALGS